MAITPVWNGLWQVKDWALGIICGRLVGARCISPQILMSTSPSTGSFFYIKDVNMRTNTAAYFVHIFPRENLTIIRLFLQKG